MDILSFTMPTSTMEIANRVATRKTGRTLRPAMEKPKPFMVTSIETKWCAPTPRPPRVKRLPPIPRPTTKKEGPSVPRDGPKKQILRPGAPSTVDPKVEPRRALSKPTPTPAGTNKVQTKSAPLLSSRAQYADRSLSKPAQITGRLKDFQIKSGRPASVKPTQVTVPNELPPRPSCIPAVRNNRSSAGSTTILKRKEVAVVQVSTAGPPNLGITRRKMIINTVASRNPTRAKVAEVKEPIILGRYYLETPTRNRGPPLPGLLAYPHEVTPEFDPDWSPPPSPDLSSFPSQTWTIVASTDAKKINSPETVCDETPSCKSDAKESCVTGTAKDLQVSANSVSSSPFLSPVSTVVGTPAGSEGFSVGSKRGVKPNSRTAAPSVELSPTACSATIISPSGNGTSSSIATLAKLMNDSSEKRSPTADSTTGNRVGVTVRSVIDIACAFLPPSQRASQDGTETTSCKIMGTGTNVSRIRELFVSPVKKDMKASMNPVTQKEIEMLRARKKVAGGGVADPSLNRLSSLPGMAIAMKHRTSCSGSLGYA